MRRGEGCVPAERLAGERRRSGAVQSESSFRARAFHCRNLSNFQNDPWLKRLEEFKGEGCRIYGKLQVAKVAGNFHFAPGEPHRIMRSHGELLLPLE